MFGYFRLDIRKCAFYEGLMANFYINHLDGYKMERVRLNIHMKEKLLIFFGSFVDHFPLFFLTADD